MARHVDLGGEPAAEGAAIRDGGQRVLLRLAFQRAAALAERVYQALLLLVGAIELPRALCHPLLQVPAVVLEVLEGARVRHGGRRLLGKPLHQVQVRIG